MDELAKRIVAALKEAGYVIGASIAALKAELLPAANGLGTEAFADVLDGLVKAGKIVCKKVRGGLGQPPLIQLWMAA